MKMVAAAKLRRAQTRLTNARPYATKAKEVLDSMVRLVEGAPHPIFVPRETPRVAEFLILTSDRGLCGGFNSNLLRRVENFIKEKQIVCPEIRIRVVGRKGRDYFKARKRELADVMTNTPDNPPFEESLKLANDLIEGYQTGRFDEFYLVYNYFRSAISQTIQIDPILPIKKAEVSGPTYVPEYIYEPSRTALLEKLIPKTLATMIHRAFLESVTGELGSRMVAMDNATNNCREMIFDLTLQMNRARQAAITTELMDIVNGAESLKK